MSLVALKLKVASAESEAIRVREPAALGQHMLAERARKQWLPRALVGAGAMLGYWLEGHLAGNRGAARVRSTPAPVHRSEAPTTAAVTSDIAGWLGLALSSFRVLEYARPWIEQINAATAANAARAEAAALAAVHAAADAAKDAATTGAAVNAVAAVAPEATASDVLDRR
ncbi:MAG: hypothetical protein ACT4NL_12235 [Pseudomarimonas sp.]